MNGRLIQNATQLATSGILRSLQAPFFSDEQRVETLFLATLSRRPSAEERATMLAHFASAPGEAEQQQALGDTLWVLLNCAEFTANH